MSQLALAFDMPARVVMTPAARRTDPITSHEAAEYIRGGNRSAIQQAQVIDAIRRHPGCTMQELADHTGLCRWMLGRRVSECETAGAVKRGTKRVCNITGRQAEPWWPV